MKNEDEEIEPKKNYGVTLKSNAIEQIGLLDHGYVKFIESFGSDERIIEAARMSTDKGFLGWDPGPCDCVGISGTTSHWDPDCLTCDGTGNLAGDAKLLKYLYEHKHSTPFEFAGLIIEIQLPIFAAREWQRHRTQGYNEMSARYGPLPDMNYIPTLERLMMNAGGSNKQAGTVKGASDLAEHNASMFRRDLEALYVRQEEFYQKSLAVGIPKELARVDLPVGRYTKMRAVANLRNWLGFLTLRQAPDAQWEIRQYADAVASLIKQEFPRTYELYAGGSET